MSPSRALRASPDVALFRAKREGRNRVMVDQGLADPDRVVAETGTEGGA